MGIFDFLRPKKEEVQTPRAEIVDQEEIVEKKSSKELQKVQREHDIQQLRLKMEADRLKVESDLDEIKLDRWLNRMERIVMIREMTGGNDQGGDNEIDAAFADILRMSASRMGNPQNAPKNVQTNLHGFPPMDPPITAAVDHPPADIRSQLINDWNASDAGVKAYLLSQPDAKIIEEIKKKYPAADHATILSVISQIRSVNAN